MERKFVAMLGEMAAVEEARGDGGGSDAMEDCMGGGSVGRCGWASKSIVRGP